MSCNSQAETLFRLTYIYWFAIVIIECVNPELRRAYAFARWILRLQESTDLFTNSINVSRELNWLGLTRGRLAGG